jgi:hypothetical protein
MLNKKYRIKPEALNPNSPGYIRGRKYEKYPIPEGLNSNRQVKSERNMIPKY